MENNNTTLHVSLGDLPISKSEVETVLDKSDGVTVDNLSLNNPDDKPLRKEEVKEKIIVSARRTGKTVLNSLLFDQEYNQAIEALYLTKREVPQIHNCNPTAHAHGSSTDELNESPYPLPELNTDNFKRLADGKIDWDYEYQKAKEKVSHWQVHEFRVPKDPLPAGKGLVTSIVELTRFDSAIWARLDKLGYNVRNLKREMKTRRMSVRQFLGCSFPRPVLEKLYQMTLRNSY